MKKLLLLILLTVHCSLFTAWAQGIPFIRNYTSTEYGGHNQNFDVMTDKNGIVYVANFEGLLYFDQSEWHMLHTPNVTRITTLFRDSRGTIWTGGYNYIGYLTVSDKGLPQMHSIDKRNVFQGEVQWIWEKEGHIYFLVSDKRIYSIRDEAVVWAAGEQLPKSGTSTYIGTAHINQCQELELGFKALTTEGAGVIFVDKNNKELFRITEDNGLCSNNVRFITYDGHGSVWGATDNGIFCIAFPSIYTHFTSQEGLHGEVTSLYMWNNKLYAGTQYGLYHLEDKQFVKIPEISYVCWQLAQQGSSLLAATADGVYRISQGGKVSHLSTDNVMSLLVTDDGFYTGEAEGIFLTSTNGTRKKISDIERVVKIERDAQGVIWVQNLYGHIWKCTDGHIFTPALDLEKETATIVNYRQQVTLVSPTAEKPFSYPAFSYADNNDYLWLTNNKGKNIYAMKGNYRDEQMSSVVYPLMDFFVRAIVHEGHLVWMGGDKGVTVIGHTYQDPLRQIKPQLRIRTIYLHGTDSILWGGYGELPKKLPDLSDEDRHIVFYYSTDYQSLLLKTQYRTRLDDGGWSAWDTDTHEEYPNLSYRNHTFEVQARDAFGRITDVVSIQFYITPPFYLRWYAMLIYILATGVIIYLLVRWRLYRLERDKHQLEKLVKERTSEVVRLEKMATVGKLTQGLIDRILNPLNYINNFAKLSQGLVKDVTANIEDEKEHMDAENYEDTIDVLGMLDGNLQKVSEHGASTTRTLKAMEEMLKDRSGGIASMDLKALLKQNEDMLRHFYEKDLADGPISVLFSLPTEEVRMMGNAEQLSKTFMSLLSNAVYAINKRIARDHAPGEIRVWLTVDGQYAVIRFRDNGIGIEETIIEKVFDPFFTTKTTGEASGVGLYLSREIVQNHGGDIAVHSEKNVFTEFTITIPLER